MKPRSTRKPGIYLAAALAVIFALALISWDRKQEQDKSYDKDHYQGDTIPGKKERKVRDLDDAIRELDEVDIDLEMEKAMRNVEKAMKDLDFQKMELDVQRAMQDVNMEKVKADVEKAMKDVDFKKIEQEVKESIAKIDFDKIQLELEKVKDIDMKEIQASMDKAREEMKKIGPQLEKELKEAKVHIEKAKAELKEYKTFVDGLENDGLINKKQGYEIEHKDGKLTINGKEASSQTYQKYRSFLEKHKKFNIEKSDDDFDIDID